MRPNWFFAFPLDGAFVLELPELPAGFRRFHPEDVHLTLAFLGGCEESAALRALSTLDEHLARLVPSAPDVSLGEVVAMGSSRQYSALSALLARGREEASALVALLRDPLADSASVPRDGRAPKPHVTLARPTRRASADDRRAGLAWAARLELGQVSARLDRIALYSWDERRTERLFRVVAERTLAPAAGRARP
jgi:RNA 2',3'-cyclic 3'-phosphodiesterase